jgi:hypothetical protein
LKVKSHVPDKDSFFTSKSYKKGFSKNIENGGPGSGFQKRPKSVTYCLIGPFNVKIDFMKKYLPFFSSVLTGQLSSVTYQERTIE